MSDNAAKALILQQETPLQNTPGIASASRAGSNGPGYSGKPRKYTMRVNCQPVFKVGRLRQSAAHTPSPLRAGVEQAQSLKSVPGCQAGLVGDATTKADGGLL